MKELYPYQKRVARTLRAGGSVVLQAPTGSGKTFAALWPFLEAWERGDARRFPPQCIYSAPVRVLTNQFEREAKRIAYEELILPELPVIKVQTGEFPDDPELTADLIFATLDQTLSSALGVPYSLSRRKANLNAGAVLGSYLVFDEFHLFPHEAAKTTLQLLRTVGKIAPFVLMTATFSQTMLEEIGDLLGATVITVPEDEVEMIETRRGEVSRKRRIYRVADAPLDAASILKVHERRTLAVCNTVDRAISLFDDLLVQGCRPIPFADLIAAADFQHLREARPPKERQKLIRRAVERVQDYLLAHPDENWAMLLHSRFKRPHRQVKEELLQALWNPDSVAAGTSPRLVVVGTQVVEVGLDISAQTLHTEAAPAASVLQRAGRCARYPGEQGTVFVYPVPENKRGEPNYAPYGMSKVRKEVCERSWEAFQRRDGEVLRFTDEQDIINEAHTRADRALLQAMRDEEGQIWGQIADALTFHDSSTRQDLIRKSTQSRTVIVYNAPEPGKPGGENPFVYEGFSLHVGTLSGKLEKLQALQKKHNLKWGLRYVTSRGNESDPDTPTAYYWFDVRDADDLKGTLLLAVHPKLAAYDAERGFRFMEEAVSDGVYHLEKRLVRRQRPDFGAYRLESYAEHIAGMRRVFERGPWQRRLRWVAHRLAQRADSWHIPEGLLERAVRLAFALHDVGKLDARWQAWAHAYQEEIGQPCPPDFMIAHTLYEKGNPEHEDAQKRVRKRHRKPKTHAGEGAYAGSKVLWMLLENDQRVFQAAVSAVARHHSPRVTQAQPYQLSPFANSEIEKAFVTMGLMSQALDTLIVSRCDAPDLEEWVINRSSDWLTWFIYFFIVRNLRLCDGYSQSQEVK